MNDSSKDLDRALLKNREAIWTNDPELNLKDDQIDSLLRYFGDSGNVSEPELRTALSRVFQTFMNMAVKERFRESSGKLEKVSKPSTIVEREMKQVQKACEELDKQITDLDPAARTWIDNSLKENGVQDESGQRVRLQHLKQNIYWVIDILSFAAKDAEGIASRGPNNTALRDMIAGLANCWEMYHGHPPTTDKARHQRDDPFLELCQKTAQIVDTRLQAKGGRLGALQLSGLVAEVLKDRASQTGNTSREK